MQRLISRNPANHAIVGEVTVSTASEITAQVKHAHAAKLPWKLLGAKKRVELLRPLLTALTQKENEILLLTTREMGKPITQAKEDFAADLIYLQHFFDHGPQYIEDEITFHQGNAIHKIVYEPRGVAACIVPWNFPLSNFLWAVIPNLIVGNTVVFKHSEECPLLGKMVGDLLSLLNLPPGVFSQIFGGAKQGNGLANENVDLIWFTGSSAAGKKLYEIAGQKLIKAILEMGGSNPAIIFNDVDLNAAIERIYHARFNNGGQICDAIKRVIVHHSIFETFVKKIAALVQQMKIGDPELKSTQLGPLVAMRQLKLIEAQVNDAIHQGATVVTGGRRPVELLAGAYYLPTILTNVTEKMRVWREETFGPVLPIVSFHTEEEAVSLANDTEYGLGAMIFSKDIERAHRVAAQIDAGCVDINEGSHWEPCNPFGGFKASGMACEHGRLGFHELCRFKVVAV